MDLILSLLLTFYHVLIFLPYFIKKEYLERSLLKGFMRRLKNKLKSKLKNMLDIATKGENPFVKGYIYFFKKIQTMS